MINCQQTNLNFFESVPMTIGLTRQRRLSESSRSAVSVLQVEEHNANQQKDKNTLRRVFLRKTIFGVLSQNLFIFLTVVTGEKCPKTNHLLREGVICAMCNENVQCPQDALQCMYHAWPRLQTHALATL